MGPKAAGYIMSGADCAGRFGAMHILTDGHTDEHRSRSKKGNAVGASPIKTIVRLRPPNSGHI